MGVVLDAMIHARTVEITPEILSFVAGIDEFKGAWRTLGTLAPDRLSALRRVAFDEGDNQLGVVFETATPFDTPRLMTELATWFNDARTSDGLHTLLLIGLWVVAFLEIRPFQDGNGRLSSVRTTLLLL